MQSYQLNIGIDMDNVIIMSWWKPYYDSFFEEHAHNEPYRDPPPTWKYVQELCNVCYAHIVNDPQLLKESPPMPGMIQGINNIREHNLHLISHRSTNLLPVVKAKMKRYGILEAFSTINVGWEPKLQTCRNLGVDVLIDDAPHNIEALKGTETTPLVFNHKYNLYIKNVKRVNGWVEIPAALNRIDNEKQS